MNDQTKSFGETARSQARNPLGIIALFIVMVYGFASLVTVFAGSFTPTERLPLIYFLVCFPVLVLGVFAWLVSKHSGKLFAPSDFKNEDNYVKVQMQMGAVASLTAATAKSDTPASEAELRKIVEAVLAAGPVGAHPDGWSNHILWVDDCPENNVYERKAFEDVGLHFTLASSTDEAFERLEQARFAAIISDMDRAEGPREGYVLLDRLRKKGDRTPLFFYSSSNTTKDRREAREHGGQGYTNDPKDLFEMVIAAVNRSRMA